MVRELDSRVVFSNPHMAVCVCDVADMTVESTSEYLLAVTESQVIDCARVLRDLQSAAAPHRVTQASDGSESRVTDMRVYFRTLRLEALDLVFNYSGQDEATEASTGVGGRRVVAEERLHLFPPLIQRLLTSPASVDGAPISVEPLYATHMFGTVGELGDWVASHLSNSLQSQLLTLLGSVDALGNPVAMFRHFRVGIEGAASGLLEADPVKVGGACVSEWLLYPLLHHVVVAMPQGLW
jgi:Vacuolar-sorting-associated 13 protein C-terminal